MWVFFSCKQDKLSYTSQHSSTNGSHRNREPGWIVTVYKSILRCFVIRITHEMFALKENDICLWLSYPLVFYNAKELCPSNCMASRLTVFYLLSYISYFYITLLCLECLWLCGFIIILLLLLLLLLLILFILCCHCCYYYFIIIIVIIILNMIIIIIIIVILLS